MLAGFTALVHARMIGAAPSSRWAWSEGALNVAIDGAAWVVADSLAARARRAPQSS